MTKLNSTTDVDGFAALLGTSYQNIRYYYYSKPMSLYYHSFEISKKNGGVRIIMSPSEQLKTLQDRLKVLLDELYTPKSSATAFIKGRSIVDNAKQHTRKKYVFNVDLSDFFTSITFPRVRGLLMAKPYSLQSGVATVVAHLCTVNGVLPQGSPCSPVISNMICSTMDRQLKGLAIRNRARYSRYADDITFSFYDDIKYISGELVACLKGDDLPNHYFSRCGKVLNSIIESCGFKVNSSKVRLQSRYERQVVTGLVVNKKANVERAYIRQTSAMIHSIEKNGLAFARQRFSEKNPPDPRSGTKLVLDAHLHGRLLFIKQVVSIESEVYRRLAMRFNFLDLNYKLPLGFSKNHRGIEFRKSTPWYDKRCWIVDTEFDLVFGQGSAFFVNDEFLVTCSHVSEFDGHFVDVAEVYRAGSRGDKYSATVVYRDVARDIAILIIDADRPLAFETFDVATKMADVGDVLSVVGFPKDKLGAQHAGRQSVEVRNKFASSGVKYFEVDKELYAGNSGGPVLDADNNVVGIVAKGNDGDYCDHSRFICISELASVLQAYEKQKHVAPVVELELEKA